MSRVVAISGVSSLTADDPRWFTLISRLGDLSLTEPVSEYRCGCSWGVDSLTAEWIALHQPAADLRLIAPEAPFDMKSTLKVIGIMRPGPGLTLFEFAEKGNNDPDSYMKRNDALVEGADELWAFPESVNELRRRR